MASSISSRIPDDSFLNGSRLSVSFSTRRRRSGSVPDGVRITRVVEHVMPFPLEFYAEATPRRRRRRGVGSADFIDEVQVWRSLLIADCSSG